MNLADCGDGVWVGDYLACDNRLADFDRAVHVFSLINVREGRLCRCSREVFEHRAAHHLVVMYTENMPLASASVPLDRIMDYCRHSGSILCHCAAGSVRGPTMAVVAKVARGVPLGRAMEDVVRAAATYNSHPLGNAGLRSLIEAGA